MSILDWFSPSALAAKLVGAIGGQVAGAVLGYHKDTLDAANTHDRINADLAQRELAVQDTETKVQAQLKIAEVGHPWEPEKLFAYVVLIYFAKSIVWDKVIGSLMGHSCYRGECSVFNTDAITSDLLTWTGMIFIFLFSKRGIENVVRIIKR
jgi:hypothetical protein